MKRLVNLHTILWGDRYREVFVKYALPSLLSEKNIPSLYGDLVYHVYADQNDYDYIKKTDVFCQLSKHCKVERKESVRDSNKSIKSSLRWSDLNDAVWVCLPPDAIFSDGSLQLALDKIHGGYRAVIIPVGAVRVNEGELPDSIRNDEKDMVGILNKHLHKETKRHFVDSGQFFDKPIQYLKNVNEGIKVKSYFYQPFVLDCKSHVYSFSNVEKDILIDSNWVYVAKDSSEIFQLALSPADMTESKNNKFSEKAVIDYVERVGVSSLNKEIFEQGYLINA